MSPLSKGVLTIPSKLIASCFALIAFAAATLVGLAAQNSAWTVLYRALIAMGVCWVVGFIVGLVAQRVVDQQIETYKSRHPITSEDSTINKSSPPAAVDAEPHAET